MIIDINVCLNIITFLSCVDLSALINKYLANTASYLYIVTRLRVITTQVLRPY